MKKDNIKFYKIATIVLSITTIALLIAFIWLYKDTRVIIDDEQYMVEPDAGDSTDERKITTIELTTDNWQDYFEWVEEVEITNNAFGEPKYVAVNRYYKLKDDILNRLAHKIDWIYDLEEKEYSVTYVIDKVNKTFTIENKKYVNTYNDVDSYEIFVNETQTNNLKIINNYSYFDISSQNSNIEKHDGYYIECSKMNRIQGTLYLYE